MRHVDMTDSQSLKPQNGSVLVFLASLQHHQHLVAITLQKVRVLQHTEATQLISDLLASIYICVFSDHTACIHVYMFSVFRPPCMYTCFLCFQTNLHTCFLCFQTNLHKILMTSMFSDQLTYVFSMFSDQHVYVFYVFRPTCTLFSMFSDQLT